jgi:aryl-alcohol dehydrogenase-like predicted oxidoreductase
MEALGELIRAGKARYWGLSNETPWGVMTCLRLADELGLPRPVSVQNAYSLLNRYNRWCVASTIIGTTTLGQLQEDIAAQQVSLAPEVLSAIEQIHLAYPNPAP